MLPIIVLGLGMMTRFAVSIPEKLGDISYGTYIYHFAMAELVFTVMPAHWRGRPAIALPVFLSAVVGWLSFQLVEKGLFRRRPSPPKRQLPTYR